MAPVSVDPERLAQVADTLSHPETIGRLSQVIDRWIYTACLCFGLDLAEPGRLSFAGGVRSPVTTEIAPYLARYRHRLRVSVRARWVVETSDVWP